MPNANYVHENDGAKGAFKYILASSPKGQLWWLSRHSPRGFTIAEQTGGGLEILETEESTAFIDKEL